VPCPVGGAAVHAGLLEGAGRAHPVAAGGLTVEKPHIAAEAHECKQAAEDPGRPVDERLVWAQLAVAAELAAIRKLLAKRRRPDGRGGGTTTTPGRAQARAR